jgi:hypothetical protein
MSERRLAGRLAVAGALAVLVVIVASAWLRRSPDAAEGAIAAARIAHRIGATAALLLVVMLPFVALRLEADRPERRVAHVALAIVIVLAVLGVATPGGTTPWITAGNLTGGFALLATLAVLAARLRDRPADPRARLVARVALVTALASVVVTVIPAPAQAHTWLAVTLVVFALVTALLVRDDRIVAAAIGAGVIVVVATLAARPVVVALVHNASAAILVAALAVAAFPRARAVDPGAAGR